MASSCWHLTLAHNSQATSNRFSQASLETGHTCFLFVDHRSLRALYRPNSQRICHKSPPNSKAQLRIAIRAMSRCCKTWEQQAFSLRSGLSKSARSCSFFQCSLECLGRRQMAQCCCSLRRKWSPCHCLLGFACCLKQCCSQWCRWRTRASCAYRGSSRTEIENSRQT